MTDMDHTPQGNMSPTIESKNRYIAPEPPRKKGKIALIVGITVAVVFMVAIAATLVWLPNDDSSMPPETTSIVTKQSTDVEANESEELNTQHEHKHITLVGVEPTCTETGLTEGVQCEICQEILIEQEVLPVTDHTYGDWIVDRQPEPAITGNRYRTCSLCDHIISETLEALPYSQGLLYYSNGDGTCRVIDIGSCTDTDIVIPAVYEGQTVTTIEMGFPPSTTSVVIPSSVTQISANMFYQCEHLTETENGVSYANGWALGVDPSFASITIREGTVGIASFAFRENETLTSVSIPESVRYIGEGAFYICPQLKEINLPKNLSEIRSSTFSLCSSLTDITIPSNVIRIGEIAFDGTGLTEIFIPERVQAIEINAFSTCKNLKTLLVHPDNEVFHSTNNCIIETKSKILVAGCQTSRIPDDGSVTTIGQTAFSGCTGLMSITIPDSVTLIKSSAFADCQGLTSMIIPDSVTRIERYAFVSCSNLTSIQLSQKLTNISENAFSGCVSLQSISIPDNVTGISAYAFSACTGLTSVTLPKKLRSIGQGAFSNCSQLTHITIPSGTIGINYQAFGECYKLTSVTIPDSVTTIYNGAFNNSLKDVYYTGTREEWEALLAKPNSHSFKNATIHYNYTPES